MSQYDLGRSVCEMSFPTCYLASLIIKINKECNISIFKDFLKHLRDSVENLKFGNGRPHLGNYKTKRFYWTGIIFNVFKKKEFLSIDFVGY